MEDQVRWESAFEVGHETIDAQHRALLALCGLLAEHSGASGDAGGGDRDERDRSFDRHFDRLKALAREHFETESSLLAASGFAGLDDHRLDCEEFDYLVDEIATTEHFDRQELQRFVTLWWIGHISGAAGAQRAVLAGGAVPGASG